MNFTSCKGERALRGNSGGLSWCSDPHWRPQVYSCGMSERLDRFRFIGDIHHSADQTRELLSHVGLWDSHGKHFINGGLFVDASGSAKQDCSWMSHPSSHTNHVGFQQRDEVSNSSAAETTYGHAQGSKGKMEKYYTPELLKRVQEELYPEDYTLWKLVSANGKHLSNGKELMTQLSSKCARTAAKNAAEKEFLGKGI